MPPAAGSGGSDIQLHPGGGPGAASRCPQPRHSPPREAPPRTAAAASPRLTVEQPSEQLTTEKRFQAGGRVAGPPPPRRRSPARTACVSCARSAALWWGPPTQTGTRSRWGSSGASRAPRTGGCSAGRGGEGGTAAGVGPGQGGGHGGKPGNRPPGMQASHCWVTGGRPSPQRHSLTHGGLGCAKRRPATRSLTPGRTGAMPHAPARPCKTSRPPPLPCPRTLRAME